MPPLFPTQTTLQEIFATQSPFYQRSVRPQSPELSRNSQKDLFPAWSAIDDVKSKAGQLSDEAQREIHKASAAAQAKAGHIELYSPKY
ncbi:hypothetical protein MMC15_001900 [Xylographa vitiligo]|nr:hypothetical protein [Xylographa vitiligo]